MRLLSSNGELVRGRCRATNQCDYCAKLGGVENAELLTLDAIEGGQSPELFCVLTTATAIPEPAHFYRARAQVMRAVKRRWPDAEYAALVEFSTGKGRNAGGRRRPHWNLLLKGVPAAELDQVRDVVTSVWCSRPEFEAGPQGQHVGVVSEIGGLMRYVALHFQKTSQAPPPGWRGHRFTASRGYLHRPTPELREMTRESLRRKRELRRALMAGHEGLEAERVVDEAMRLAAETEWELVNWTEHLTRASKTVPERIQPPEAGDIGPVRVPAVISEAVSVARTSADQGQSASQERFSRAPALWLEPPDPPPSPDAVDALHGLDPVGSDR